MHSDIINRESTTRSYVTYERPSRIEALGLSLSRGLPSWGRSLDGVRDRLACTLRLFDSDIEFQLAGGEVLDDGVITSGLNELSSC